MLSVKKMTRTIPNAILSTFLITLYLIQKSKVKIQTPQKVLYITLVFDNIFNL